MNCVNHPDVAVTAYCQNCGKPLCQECVRSVGGVVYCEQCLAARMNVPVGAKAPFVGLPPVDGPNPGLALGLGFIPGVGAMYNGQFVKGTVHVLIFALLCSIAGHTDFFGFLIPFWIAYQVFDAYQTAKARRDGTPLPNPFGLNDLGHRLGLQPHPETPTAAPFVPFSAAQNVPGAPPTYTTTPFAEGQAGYTPVEGVYDPYAPPGAGPVSGFVPGAGPGGPGTPYGQVPGPGYGAGFGAGQGAGQGLNGTFGSSGVPVGAVVLIGLGVLFLLSSMGIFRDEWLGRSWPLILVGIGVWLIVKRTRNTQNGPRGGNGQ